MKIGDLVALKYLGKIVKGVVIEIDTDFFTIQFKYGRGSGCKLRVKNGSNEIISINGIAINPFTHRNDIV